MDSVEDTLSKEINRIGFSRGGDDTQERQRPITTGILEVKQAKTLGNRKNIDYVDTAEATASNCLRPRAPMAGRRRVRDTGESGPGKEVLTDTRKRDKGSNRHSRSKKSNSITVLWESLHHFSKNNLGRSLTDQNVSGSEVSPSEGVHFVNLSTLEEDDNYTATAPSALSNRPPHVQMHVNEARRNEVNSSTSSSSREQHPKATGNLSTIAGCNASTASTRVATHPAGRMFSAPRDPVEVMSAAPTAAGHGRVTGVKSFPSSQFVIPELPSGKLLSINILSTWGDPHYVGLMGIDVFSSSGHLLHLSNPETQIWADPADINVLPEYEHDPRTIDNILDGVNHTCDDLHAWLAPYTGGHDHMIYMEFDEVTTISMIRIWNYNKNRIHSYRGARYIEINLDSSPIFKGEVKRAPGAVLTPEDCSECILYTTSEIILSLVEKYDPVAPPAGTSVYEDGSGSCVSMGRATGVPSFLQGHDFIVDGRADYTTIAAAAGNVGNTIGCNSRGANRGRASYRYGSRAPSLSPTRNNTSPTSTTADKADTVTSSLSVATTARASSYERDQQTREENMMSNQAIPRSSRQSLQCQSTPPRSQFAESGLERIGATVGVWAGSNTERPATGKQKIAARGGSNGVKTGEDTSLVPVVTSSRGDRFVSQSGITAGRLGKKVKKTKKPLSSSGGDEEEEDAGVSADPLSMSYNSIPDAMFKGGKDGSGGMLSCHNHLHSKVPGQEHMSPMLVRPSTAAVSRGHDPLHASVIELRIQSNWGDEDVVGLTGISALDHGFTEVHLPAPDVSLLMNTSAAPSSNACCMSSVNALVDGINLTTDPAHLWHVTNAPKQAAIVLRFDLGPQPVSLRGLRIWNYNRPGEETCRGAKHVHLFVDGVSKLSLILRKAPGERNIEYAQFVHLVGKERSSCSVGDSISLLRSESKSGTLSRSASLSKMTAGTRSTVSISDSGENILDGSVAASFSTNQPPLGMEPTDTGATEGGRSRRLNKMDSFDRVFPKKDDAEDEDEDEEYAVVGKDQSEHSTDRQRGVIRGNSGSMELSGRNHTSQRQGTGPVGLSTGRRLVDGVVHYPSPLSAMSTDMSSWGEEMSFVADTGRVLCDVTQQYETPVNPCGTMMKVVLLSSHGDLFYIGLNGFQIFDEHGSLVELSEDQLQATPYRDVNDLPEIQARGEDARRLANLIHIENDTFNDSFMWLAPLSSSVSPELVRSFDDTGSSSTGAPNTIYVLFDEPQTISCMKFWNYSKTPSRGAKEIEVFVDDVLVYKGNLKASPHKDSFFVKRKSLSIGSSVATEGRGYSCNVGSSADATANAASSVDSDEQAAFWWITDNTVQLSGPEGRGCCSGWMDLSQAIIFTNDPVIVSREGPRVPFSDDCIDFIDEGRHLPLDQESTPSPPHALTDMGHADDPTLLSNKGSLTRGNKKTGRKDGGTSAGTISKRQSGNTANSTYSDSDGGDSGSSRVPRPMTSVVGKRL